MSGLEPTYRRALRWYPKRWRAANEDALVGTLMDQADDENRDRPARGELADLRTNALATRLGPLARIPAPVRDRAAALAFGLGGGIAIVALIAMAVQKATMPSFFLSYLPIVGPFIGYSFLFYGTWIVALVAALIGWKWVARGLAIAGILVAIVARVIASGLPMGAPTTTTIVFVGLLALLSLVGDPFRSARGRLWILIGASSWAAFMGLTIWYQRATEGSVAGSTDWFVGPLWQWLYFVVPFALILALVLRSVRRSPWAGAILIMLVPITLFVLFGWGPRSDDVIDRATLLGIAIAIIAAVYVVPRLFGLRISITRT